MRHVGNRDSNKNRSLLSVIIIKLLYYMTAILYKALYMTVLIIGCPFLIIAAIIYILIYIIMKTYATLTIPILWIILRVHMTIKCEEARRKGIYITPCTYRDMTIFGISPWGIDDKDDEDNEYDDIDVLDDY